MSFHEHWSDDTGVCEVGVPVPYRCWCTYKSHICHDVSTLSYIFQAIYLLNSFGLGWISPWWDSTFRRNVLCNSQNFPFEDVHRLPVASHSLGAVPNTLHQGKPSWKTKIFIQYGFNVKTQGEILTSDLSSEHNGN